MKNLILTQSHIANRKRVPDYINLKYKIESATCTRQLESMREVLTTFVRTNKGNDANDLMVLYLQKCEELNPYYEDETLTTLHRNKCGAH